MPHGRLFFHLWYFLTMCMQSFMLRLLLFNGSSMVNIITQHVRSVILLFFHLWCHLTVHSLFSACKLLVTVSCIVSILTQDVKSVTLSGLLYFYICGAFRSYVLLSACKLLFNGSSMVNIITQHVRSVILKCFALFPFVVPSDCSFTLLSV